MNYPVLLQRLVTFVLSLSFLLLSRMDLGQAGLFVMLFLYSFLIFFELHIIRSTLLEVYADAISESRTILFFLKPRIVNTVLTIIFSVYFATQLILFTNLSSRNELVIIGLSGLILTVITPSIAESWFKAGAAKVFGRIWVISIFVFLAILIDGAYTVLSPIDPRINGPLDENIPDYVIEDVRHSFLYFQHLLRSITFLNMNIESIGLCAQDDLITLCSQTDSWFSIVRFIFVLSPTPYIAYALLLLSIMSIQRIIIVR